jgi:glycosyltransferase involved in cell wall biosynthesis
LSRRHEVSLVAVGSQDDNAIAELEQLCARVEVVTTNPLTGLRWCLGAAVRGYPLQWGVCHSESLDRRVAEVLASDTFDMVHIEHLRAARLRDLLPATIPSLFDSVDSISLLLERTLRSSHSLRQRMLARIEVDRTRRFESSLLRRFDRVIATSFPDAGRLEALATAGKVSVLPNGVDLARFRPLSEPSEPATLVFSGKMSYHANVSAVRHFVSNVLPRVRSEHPEVRLRIVGSAPPRSVQALAQDPAITVTGYVSDMRDALGRATVAVCPMTVKVGIQNKVLEAMALGVPVVASRAGAEGLAAVAGRDFLVSEDALEMAHDICQLLSNARQRAELAHAGRHYVENHHRWEVIARRLEALYAGAAERHALTAAH